MAGAPDSTMLDAILERGLLNQQLPLTTKTGDLITGLLRRPIVIAERGGFDAIIGNPPFLGGKKISGLFGLTSASGL